MHYSMLLRSLFCVSISQICILDRFLTIETLYKQVIAERLSEEEIGGLKQLFKMIDTDNSGTITYDELKDGLKRVGSDLVESEIKALMNAVLSILICFRISKDFVKCT